MMNARCKNSVGVANPVPLIFLLRNKTRKLKELKIFELVLSERWQKILLVAELSPVL